MKLRLIVRVLGVAAATLLATSGWSQTWVSTSTKGLGPLLANAASLGPLPAATSLRITVGLALPNPTGLNQYIQAINDPNNPLYGRSLTPDQFTAAYGPSSAQVQAVTDYLSANGFVNIQVEPGWAT